LRNHLQSIAVHAAVADFDATYQIDRIKTLVARSPQFESFLKARFVHQSKDPTEFNKLRAAAVELGKEFFPELYTVVSCAATDELKELRQLFDKRILTNADEVFKDFCDFNYESDPLGVDRWKNAIEARRGLDRPFATFVDAIACAYLEAVNRKHCPGELAVYVSQAYDVTVPLSQEMFRSQIAEKGINIVRDIDFLWVACVHDRNLERVRDSLQIVKDLIKIYDFSTGQAEQMTDSRKRVLVESEPLWRRAENLMLLGDSHLLPGGRDVRSAVHDNFLSWMDVIANASTESAAALEQQGRALFDHIRQQISELGLQLPATSSLDLIKIVKTTRGVLVSVPGMWDEMTATVEIFDRPAVALAKRMRQAKSERARLSLRDEIMKLGSDVHASNGIRLLSAYFLAIEERYEEALKELHLGLGTASGLERKEFLYVTSMVQRKLFAPSEAFDSIQAALEADATDPRFHVECGKILWLGWHMYQGKSKITSDLDDAVKHLQWGVNAADGKDDSRPLLADAENALAFIHCERALAAGDGVERKALGAAEAHLRNLELLFPIDQWTGRYNDTRAWILYARALLARTDGQREESRKLLGEAEKLVSNAMDREQRVRARQELLKSHLSAIRIASEQNT
jgi:hypothetical protein